MTYVCTHAIPVINKLLSASLYNGSGMQWGRFICQIRTIVRATLQKNPQVGGIY